MEEAEERTKLKEFKAVVAVAVGAIIRYIDIRIYTEKRNKYIYRNKPKKAKE